MKESNFNLRFLYYFYMDFNVTKWAEILWKYLSNDANNIFLSYISNEILQKSLHGDKFITVNMHSKWHWGIQQILPDLFSQ